MTAGAGPVGDSSGDRPAVVAETVGAGGWGAEAVVEICGTGGSCARNARSRATSCDLRPYDDRPWFLHS